ncbi:MAG TPA: hypothetical protein VGJ14_20475 [Sporichthyaceae bacterium]
MSNSIQTRVLPWASAAGALVLVAGTIAAQAGAGAASVPSADSTTPAANSHGVPLSVAKAMNTQLAGLVKHQQSAPTAVTKAAPAAPVATTADKKSAKYDWENSSYIFDIRSAGIEYYDKIPRDLQQDQGFSFVELTHDLGQDQGRCEAWGAAYWLGQEVEEGVLGFGAAPPDAGNVSGGYHNPTTSRQVRPNLSAGQSESDRHPAVVNYFPPGNDLYAMNPDGPGYKWTAACDNDVKGQGQGDDLNIAGFQSIGSTAEASLDKVTGVYVGTSRAYFFGLEGASGFDSGSSFMQITNHPNSDATITYRMSYFNSGDNNSKNGITFGGTDVPVEDFAKQFNDQAQSGSTAMAPVGPAGAATLAPEVGVSTDGDRYSITISAGHGHLGFAARDGGLGQDQGARIGSVTFSGVYGNGN